MTLGRAPPLSEPQFCHLYDGDNNSDPPRAVRAVQSEGFEARINKLGEVSKGPAEGSHYHTSVQRAVETEGCLFPMAPLDLPRERKEEQPSILPPSWL